MYSSKESLKNAFKGVDALYLNYALVQNEVEIEKMIIDAAIESGVNHIIYATTACCEKDHNVPHWESSRKTNEYLKECLAKKKRDGCTDGAFRYHLVQLAHFNENILPDSYFPPTKGWITYPWRSDARVATSSLRDVARVACKLFAEPDRLPNGSSIDAVTEFVSVNDICKAVSEAKGEEIRPSKGPWIFTTFGHWFGWEASSILHMAEHIDKYEFVDDINFTDMSDFLQEEIQTEPLETMERFAKRYFATESNQKVHTKQPICCGVHSTDIVEVIG